VRSPSGTKGTICLIAVCTLLNTVGAAGFLTLVPNSTVASGHFWNLVTFSLVEAGLLQAAVSITVLGTVGRVAEPLWGTGEFVKFLVLVNLFTGVCLWVDCYILFQGSGNEAYLLNPKMGCPPSPRSHCSDPPSRVCDASLQSQILTLPPSPPRFQASVGALLVAAKQLCGEQVAHIDPATPTLRQQQT